MKSHRWIQEHLYDLEQGSLTPNDRATVEHHLSGCTACSNERAALRSALSAIPSSSYRPSSERPEMFWQMFAQRVEGRLQSAHEEPATWVEQVRDIFAGHRSVFALGFGSALLLVAATATAWILTHQQPESREFAQRSFQGQNPLVQTASLEERTEQYLDRSKILLVGLINTDAKLAEKEKMNFNREVEVSRELVKESRQLASELNDPDQQQMKRLVSDLEVILLQIATLQGEAHSPAIEIVKGGVERKSILMKINLEEIQRAKPTPARTPSTKQSI